MKKIAIKIPLKSWLLYLCVALFLTTGVTFSRYIATSSTSGGSRVAQFGDLILTETTGADYTVIPGVPIAKDPKLTMSQSAVAVRVTVELAFGSQWQREGNRFSSPHSLLSFQVAQGWTYKGQEGTSFYFSRDLAPGEGLTQQAIIENNEITVSASVSYEDFYRLDPADLEIAVSAKAEQID